VIVLNRRAVIRIQSVSPRGRFLVGYFTSVQAINDHGRPIDLADIEVEGLGRAPPAAGVGERCRSPGWLAHLLAEYEPYGIVISPTIWEAVEV
jgi:hypothetical protein